MLTVAITGGTGSFGSALAHYLYHVTPYHIRIISRDEHRQETMARRYPPGERLTYILSDIRNTTRMAQALAGVDVLVHAAALKTVGAGERQGGEVADVNINGTRAVIDAALAADVPRSLLISSDKAVDPVNFYGATKRVAEGLFSQANQIGLPREIRFGVVRGGNVWASRGSVAEIWRRTPGRLQVYGLNTTRFHLLMGDWVKFAWLAALDCRAGEIIVPRPRAWRLGDLVEATGREWTQYEPRGGDKPHESLVSALEFPRARMLLDGTGYAIAPIPELQAVMEYRERDGAPMTGPLTSETAPRLSVAELRELWNEA